MKSPTTTVVLFLLSAFAAGCASYPMGMTEEEWKALTPEKQAEYREKQAEIDRKNAEIARAAAEARAAREAEEAQKAAERRAALIANARQGDIINVTVYEGQICVLGKRRPYQPVSFELIRGETKLVEFVDAERRNLSSQYTMTLSEDGKNFYFDSCRGLRLVPIADDGWAYGRVYHPPAQRPGDGAAESAGIAIRIQHKLLPPPPTRIIIENR